MSQGIDASDNSFHSSGLQHVSLDQLDSPALIQ